MPEQDNLPAVTEPRTLTLAQAPDVVLAEAQRAAAALRDVLAQKPNPIMMNGEQYLEFEDWQTMGSFYGVTAGAPGDPEYVQFETGESTVRGFRAHAVALCRGAVISEATAYCLDDEEKWRARPKYEWQYVTRDGELVTEDPGKDRIVWEENPAKPGKKRPKKQRALVGEERVPLYQLASMAQTRACAKALRNVLARVVVLAGYRPTPAEEMTGVTVIERPREQAPQSSIRESLSSSDSPIDKARQKRLFEHAKAAGHEAEHVKRYLHDRWHLESTAAIRLRDYDAILARLDMTTPLGDLDEDIPDEFADDAGSGGAHADSA